jgi:NO-binding membrane sensor protein with MHYT domain
MGHINHFSFGLFTPAVGFVVMAMAAAVGLRCTMRALSTSGPAKRGWLLTGSTALGAGIWTLHFIAMLGFGVGGTDIRYNIPLTLLSLVLAISVVSAGVCTVGYSQATVPALLIGGLGTGLGVATMHYSGMAAVNLSGAISYNVGLVALSVAIAVTAATVALWIVLNIHGMSGTLAASLIMAVAVSSMHYTAMASVSVELAETRFAPVGATAMEFLLPLSIGIGAVLFIACTFVAVSPIDDEREDAEIEARMKSIQYRRDAFAQQAADEDFAAQHRARRSVGLPVTHRTTGHSLPQRPVRRPTSNPAGEPDSVR